MNGSDGLVHQLRRATLDDVPFLVDVVVVATRAQGRLPPDFEEDGYRSGFADWTIEQISDDFSESTLSVIAVDGEPVGRLRVVRTESAIELAGIQLLPEFQSCGIGSSIVVALIDEATATSRTMSLAVERDNPGARHLYLRLGFVETGWSDEEIAMTYGP